MAGMVGNEEETIPLAPRLAHLVRAGDFNPGDLLLARQQSATVDLCGNTLHQAIRLGRKEPVGLVGVVQHPRGV